MKKLKKFMLGGLAAAAVIAPIALTGGSASAATTDANGVITISKDEIKSAMGWKNEADWVANTDTQEEVNQLVSKVTASMAVATPVDVPGGWLTLNGQIVENYPSDEYFKSWFTDPLNWGPNSTPDSSYWTNDSATAITVTATYGGSKVNGLKVTTLDTDGYVEYTRHTTYTNPDYNGATYVYHATSRWPASVAGSGVSDVKVNGKAVTVTPYVAPA